MKSPRDDLKLSSCMEIDLIDNAVSSIDGTKGAILNRVRVGTEATDVRDTWICCVRLRIVFIMSMTVGLLSSSESI